MQEQRMKHLVSTNRADELRTKCKEEGITSEKILRQRNWQIHSVTESFKQHGHLYVAILNLASHLSNHSVARALMVIGNRNENKTKAKPTTGNVDDVVDLAAVRMKVRRLWKKAITAVINESLSLITILI